MSNFAQNIRLLRAKKQLKQEDLAGLVGITGSTLSNYEIGKTEPSLDTLVKFASAFQVPVDVLLTGDASLIEKTSNRRNQRNASLNASLYASLTDTETTFAMESRVPYVVTVDKAGNDSIAYVPVKARAGYLAGYQDPEYVSTLPTYSFPGMQNATFRMWEIDGHSMIPTFDDSDIIVGRFIENLAQIRNDRVHIIVTKNDGVLIKRVFNRVESDGKLILNSDNQRDPRDYPPIVIGIEEVSEVWYGVAKFSRQMRRPSQDHDLLVELSARVTLLEERQRTKN